MLPTCRRILLLSAAVFLFASLAHAQDRPKVLLIGDSISIGYEPHVTKALKDVAEVHKLPENGAHTRNGLAKLDQWLGKTPWSVIHFNWGLHDLVDGGKAVPLEEYQDNLDKLVARLKKSGAVLILATTTPVPPKNARKRTDADVVAYNKAAEAIARKHGVRINDLYAVAKPRLAEWQQKDDVHFQPAGSAGLGQEVAATIRAALKSESPPKK